LANGVEESKTGLTSGEPKYVVGIGSSAGGVEALVELLASIPRDTKNAYVIIQHMSPDFKTMLPEILSRQSPHDVALAQDGVALRAGCFYLIPPSKMLTVFHGRILLEDRAEAKAKSYFPINHFFESLAKDAGRRAIGIVLSGTGSDGTIGVKALKANYGYVIVQTPDSSKFSGMPRSAIASKASNAILPISEIGKHLDEYGAGIRGASVRPQFESSKKNTTALDKAFFALRNHHGIDFSCYKAGLISRRMERRTKITGCADIDAYCEHILKNTNELDTLYDDLLLGVTEFNRHPESLDQLREVVFPQLVQAGEGKDMLRIWVVGCSTGEEPFTLAFMLSDYLKEHKNLMDFKIFATDVDDKSLRIASRAIYPMANVRKLPEQWQEDHFQIKDGLAHIRSRIRERVVFANHNVIKNAPFPAIDLITCRNLFIYLKAEVKKKVVRSFQFSLSKKGYLLLGPNEGLPRDNTGFSSLHSEVKLFQCIEPVKSVSKRNGETSNFQKNKREHERIDLLIQRKSAEDDLQATLHSKLINNHYGSALIFNQDLYTEFYYGNVKEYCNPLSGRASHQLSDVLPDDVYNVVGSLRETLTESVMEAMGTLIVPKKSDYARLLEIRLVDLQLLKDGKKLFLLKFQLKDRISNGSDPDSAVPTESQAKNSMLENEIRSIKKHLLDSRSEMASVVGQLEASNEELRTTNEELQSGSEELQSTNEELQAVNEELYTVNAECQMRIAELSEMSNDVQNIYEVSEIGTLFVDNNLRIRKFNSSSQKIFNLLPDDLGRPLEHFSTTLKVNFSAKVKSVLKTVRMYQKEIVSSDGVTYLMRIAPYRTDDLQIKGVVLVFIDVSSLKKAQNKLIDVKDELALITEESSDLIVRLDLKGNLLWANENFCDFFSTEEIDATHGKQFADFVHPDFRKDASDRLSSWRKNKLKEDSFQYQHNTIDGQQLEVLWRSIAKFDQRGVVKQYISIGRIVS
jgi:two-component system CheB/CheR fusion protein